MRIQLFDADDLKGFEDLLFRAMVRAFRVAKREGLIQGLEQVTPPAFPGVTEVEPAPTLPQVPPPPAHANGNGAKQERRRYVDYVQTADRRPDGYITMDEGRDIIGGNEDNAVVILRNWIFAKEVKALIVADGRLPPTKGCPGRLMVDRKSVEARNDLRVKNALAIPTDRKKAPVYATTN